MSERERKLDRSRDAEGRDETRGAPGTTAGRAGTAGTEGANVPRRDRAPGGERGGKGARKVPRRRRTMEDEVVDAELGMEGVHGEGDEESGTLPGSVGGTTGTSGRSAGVQSPGGGGSGFRGISPEEARRRREEGERRRREGRGS